jgi:hypothetical protein
MRVAVTLLSQFLDAMIDIKFRQFLKMSPFGSRLG